LEHFCSKNSGEWLQLRRGGARESGGAISGRVVPTCCVHPLCHCRSC